MCQIRHIFADFTDIFGLLRTSTKVHQVLDTFTCDQILFVAETTSSPPRCKFCQNCSPSFLPIPCSVAATQAKPPATPSTSIQHKQIFTTTKHRRLRFNSKYPYLLLRQLFAVYLRHRHACHNRLVLSATLRMTYTRNTAVTRTQIILGFAFGQKLVCFLR